MKKVGKVLEYDGYVGYIIDDEGIKYIFTNSDLKSTDITVNDLVKFNPETYETIEIKENTARFIEKINTNNREKNYINDNH